MPTLVNVGDVLAGKYRVEKVLGVGGMGMVVAATHLELEQKVALKFMLPDAMRSPQAVERFLREAKSSVRLRSEHICRVLDVGKLDDGAPYIVMEFMEGHDFADLIAKRGALSVPEAVEYVMQAIEGVAEAHANKIVHRDLKPANLFVTTENDGTPLVKVLDFGISKSAAGGAATRTGEIMGSPAYMAPEQMRSSKDVDARADVWALGVILYQAVTGRLPFEGDTLPALCMAVMNDQPYAPIAWRSDLPAGFSEVVMCCLEKPIERRFSDVAVLAAALVPFGRPDVAEAATRVAKVLRRTSTPVVGVRIDAAAAFMETHVGPNTPVPQVNTTLGGASGQFAAAARGSVAPTSQPRQTRWWIAGAAAVVVVAAAGVALTLLRDKPSPASAQVAAGSGSATAAWDASVSGPPQVAVAPVAPPPTPPVDDRSDRSKVIVRDTLDAFVAWSKSHSGERCPRVSELSTGTVQDAWGKDLELTCTDQPANVIAGVISAGPDGTLHTADDIESWRLDDATTALAAGPRWQPKSKSSKKVGKSSVATGAPLATTPATVIQQPVPAAQPETVMTDKNGIPIKR